MKKLVFLFFIVCFYTSISQTYRYNPSAIGTPSNKPYGSAQAFATDGRSWIYDSANFVYRPFSSMAEVLYYLYLPKFRAGNFSVYINQGGTLVNGVFMGGVVNEFWFQNGTADSNLVIKTGSIGSSADSLKHLFVDTSKNTNGFALTFDSIYHKWRLAPASRPFFFVRDYGAIGDGVTDDRIPIQNAINAATAVNGVVMLDSSKTYITGAVSSSGGKIGVQLKPNVYFALAPGSALKLKGSSVTNGNPVAVIYIPATATNVAVGWPFGKGGTIDANKDNQPGWTGGYSQSGGNYGIGAAPAFDGIVIENIKVKNTFSNSINLGGTAQYGNSKNLRISNVVAEEFGEGIQMIATDNVFIENVTHIMDKAIVVGDALELAFCRNFSIVGCVTKTKDSSSITVGGSGFDLYASRNGTVNGFYVQGTVYGNQTETDFSDTSNHPDNIVMSNIIMRDINFSPFVWTGGNISVSNVQILNNRFSGPQISRNNKSSTNYRFDNYYQQGKGSFYIGDSIKVTGSNMTFVLDSAVDAVFSVNTSELDINGVQIKGTAGAPLQVVDGTHPYGRFIGISTNILGISAIPIISSGSDVVDVDSLLILGAPVIKATNGSPASLVGCGAADIVGNLNSGNMPRGSKDQVVTLTGIYGVSLTNGSRLHLSNNTSVSLPSSYDQIVLQYGSDDVWREVSRSITSVDSRSSLQSVTDIGDTTNHLITIKYPSPSGYSGIRMYNNQGKYFDLGYGNSTNGFGTTFRISHSSGTFTIIDSVGNFGIGTTPTTPLHIVRSVDPAYITLTTLGAASSGIQYYTNSIFRGIQEFNSAGNYYFYHSASNTFPWYVFPNGRIRYGDVSAAEDGSGAQFQFTGKANVSDSLAALGIRVTDPATTDKTGVFYWGTSNLRVGSKTNRNVDIIANDSAVARVSPDLKVAYVKKPFLVSNDTLAMVYKKYVDSIAATISGGGGVGRNIYNADSTLSSTRTVTMSGRTLNFTGGYVGISQAIPSQALHIHGQLQLDTTSTGVYSDSLLVEHNGLIKRMARIDTAAVYAKIKSDSTVLATATSLKLNITDTAAMLAAYRIDSVTKYFQRSLENFQTWVNASTNNGTSFSGTGMQFVNIGGTATARSAASTNIFTQYTRVGLVATSAAAAVVGYKNNYNNAWLGNGAGKGGFDFSLIAGNSSATATDAVRGYVVMTTTTGTITTEPSVGTNFFGFAYSSGGTNWKFWNNDGSGTADSIDLGANFPTNTTSTDLYKFQISSPGNASKVYYQITNLSTGAVANGSVTTNLPTNTTFFGYQFQFNSAAVTGAPAMDIITTYYGNRYGLTGNVGNILNY